MWESHLKITHDVNVLPVHRPRKFLFTKANVHRVLQFNWPCVRFHCAQRSECECNLLFRHYFHVSPDKSKENEARMPHLRIGPPPPRQRLQSHYCQYSPFSGGEQAATHWTSTLQSWLGTVWFWSISWVVGIHFWREQDLDTRKNQSIGVYLVLSTLIALLGGWQGSRCV